MPARLELTVLLPQSLWCWDANLGYQTRLKLIAVSSLELWVHWSLAPWAALGSQSWESPSLWPWDQTELGLSLCNRFLHRLWQLFLIYGFFFSF